MSQPETVDADEDDLAYAVGRYALGGISLGKAASLAGVDQWTMREVLMDAGIELRLGPQDMEDLEQEVDVAMALGTDDQDNGDE